MKNITDNVEGERKPNKWEGNPLVPITAFGIITLIGLSIAGAFNYTMNVSHLKKSGINRENVEFFSLFRPGYYAPMYKGEFEKAEPGYKLKSKKSFEENNDAVLDSTEFLNYYKKMHSN